MKTSGATGFQLLVVALCLSKFLALGATIRAAAYVTPAEGARGAAKSHYGYIIFSQDTPTVANTKNTNPVTVDVSNLRGFPTEEKSIHDGRTGMNLNGTMSALSSYVIKNEIEELYRRLHV